MVKYFISKLTPDTVSTVAKDLMRIVPSTLSDVSDVRVHEVRVNFETTTIQSMRVDVGIGRKGGGTNALTTIASKILDNSQIIAKSNVYGQASTNTTSIDYYDSQFINTLSGYLFIPDRDWAPIVRAGEKFIIRVDSTHTDDVKTLAQVIFSESC